MGPILNSIDISLEVHLPNSLLFVECNKEKPKEKSKKGKKKKNRIKSNELFYGDGILGNLYNLKKCDYNWFFGYLFFRQYNNLFKDFNFTAENNIKCFHVGLGNGGFIIGMEYYFNELSKKKEGCDIQWLGIEKHLDNSFILEHKKNIIFLCITIYNNLNYVKNIIEDELNKIHLLTNHVVPKFKKNKILISMAILSITILHSNGVLLTRILNLEDWDDDFLHYILLFGMIFENIQICRYPVCKKKYIRYRYYLICHGQKPILHVSNVYRKLVMLLKNNEIKNLLFLPNIIANDKIQKWKDNILTLPFPLSNTYSYKDNPEEELNSLISLFKD